MQHRWLCNTPRVLTWWRTNPVCVQVLSAFHKTPGTSHGSSPETPALHEASGASPRAGHGPGMLSRLLHLGFVSVGDRQGGSDYLFPAEQCPHHNSPAGSDAKTDPHTGMFPHGIGCTPSFPHLHGKRGITALQERVTSRLPAKPSEAPGL